MTPARTGWELDAFSIRRRHHHRPRLTAVLALAVLAAACGTQTSPTAPVISINPVGPTIKAAYLSQVHATVLVNDAGHALYMFLPDHQRGVTCTGLCATDWPPLFEQGSKQLQAGHGVDASLLGAATDSAGGTVATYNHWSLYTYADDTHPGLAAGQDRDVDGGYWYLLRPDDSPLVPSGEPSATTTTQP